MKKLFRKLIIAGLIFSFCASVFAIEAKVESVSGKVQVQKNDTWVDLKIGDIVKKGDMIQTGFKSEAVFTITSAAEKSKITMAQLSRLTIEQLMESPAGDKTSVYLTTGSVRSEIKKTSDLRASYTVRSPVATASVRGTELTVSNGFNSTNIQTHSGVVASRKTKPSEKAAAVAGSDSESVDVAEAQFGVSDISQGQTSSFAGTVQVSASDNMVKTSSSIVNSNVASAASKEAVATSSSSSAPTEGAKTSAPAAATGSLNVIIQFDNN